MHLKHRHPMKKKQVHPTINHIEKMLGCIVHFKKLLECAEWNGLKVILLDGSLDVIMLDEGPFLTIVGINKYHPSKRYVAVDRGAVSFVLNSADIMAPGITEADVSIQEGDIVWVRNPEGTCIALGRALMSGLEMETANKGKAVENLYHIGDNLWRASTTL
jgi:PUA domain protein